MKIIPVDLKICQGEKIIGNAFSLGGVPKLIHCKNKAAFIAKEKRPGSDGLIGSMSLCKTCLPIAKKQLGNKITVKGIVKP